MQQFTNPKYYNLAQVAADSRDNYANANPFPFIKFDDFFSDDLLNNVLNEFPDLAHEDAREFSNSNERKFAGKGEISFGGQTRLLMHFLNSEPFLEFIQSITGIEEKLLGDPYFTGGGLHEIKPGGLLKVHADFNKNRLTGLDRRVNVLIYLNKDWEDTYGGHFELWNSDVTECAERILPLFNRLVIFTTTDFSYHGHPNPLTCPDHRSRKSLALYYYSNGRPDSEINPSIGDHSTLFKETTTTIKDDEDRPTDNILRLTRRVIKSVTPPIILDVVNIIARRIKPKSD